MKRSMRTKFNTVNDYLSAFPAKTRSVLRLLRKAIREVVPEADEIISYNTPAFKLNGMLLYYAAYKHHIGFYPFRSAIRFFKDELTTYETSTSTIRFPIDSKLPIRLIRKIVKLRVAENMAKARLKSRAQ